MAAVEEAFLAQCRSEAGLYSHGWAPHCKHFERMRERSPAEMWRGGEHVGKFCFLAHSQPGISWASESVLPWASSLAGPPFSSSLKSRHPLRVNGHVCSVLNIHLSSSEPKESCNNALFSVSHTISNNIWLNGLNFHTGLKKKHHLNQLLLHFFVQLVNSLSLLCYICHPCLKHKHQTFGDLSASK